MYETAIWGWQTVTIPNPDFDPTRPVGPFNQPTTTQNQWGITGYNTGIYNSNLRAAPGNSSASWRLTYYSSDNNGSSYTEVTPTTAAGVFTTYVLNSAQFTGDVDWSAVDRFSIGGIGGTEPFHAAFDTLAVPEPSTWGMFVGAGP